MLKVGTVSIVDLHLSKVRCFSSFHVSIYCGRSGDEMWRDDQKGCHAHSHPARTILGGLISPRTPTRAPWGQLTTSTNNLRIVFVI